MHQPRLLQLFRNMLIYGGGDVLVRFVNLLLLPLFTSYLTPQDYGISSILGLITFFVAPVISLGLGAALGPCYFESDSQRHRLTTVWTAVALATFMSALMLAAGMPSAGCIAHSALDDASLAPLVRLTLLTITCIMLIEPFNLRLRFEERPLAVSVLSVASALVTIGFNVVLVVVLHRGVQGLVEAGLWSRLLTLALFATPVIMDKQAGFSWPIGRSLIRTGLPLVPSFAFVFFLQHGNKYLLQSFRGLGELGIYQIGFTLGSVLSLGVNAFQSAWYPYFMSFTTKPAEAQVQFARVFQWYVAGFGFLTLAFFACARAVVLLMTQPAYHDAWRVVGLVAASEFCRGLYCILLPPVYFARQTWSVAVVQAGACAVALLAGRLLVPAAGMTGAALMLVGGMLAMAGLQAVWNTLHHAYSQVSYPWQRPLLTAATLAALAGVTLTPRAWAPGLEIVAALAMVLLGGLVALALLAPEERRRLGILGQRS